MYSINLSQVWFTERKHVLMYKTVHPKIAFVLGFLVHDMEFVEFDRNVLLVVDCITKKT